MKWNESGLSSLEIVAYILIILCCLLIITGVFTETIGVVNDNSVQER